jgi:hypothetical protein
MAFVYRHIRLDKNEPFYIGIATSKYRPVRDTCRNIIWDRIVAKTKYEVEILFEDVSVEFAKEKEIEFIKLYGRLDRGTGTLCNLTDGGDGIQGYVFTEQDKKKMSEKALGKKMSEAARLKMSKHQKLPIIQYDLDGNYIKDWDGIVDAAKQYGYSTNILRCCKGMNKQAYGFIWKYKYPEMVGKRKRGSAKVSALQNKS